MKVTSPKSSNASKLQKRGLDIMQVLDKIYPNPPIPLDHTNDFTFLVAVVLSAQTTDGKVNQVTKELFMYADNPYDMAKLDAEFVQSIIQPVGLAPKKSQYIVGLSKLLIENFQGKVPNTFEDLESLPGVGHKTASVIMSQLFKISAFAVDTHVHRLALRWGLTKETRNVDKVQEDLCAIFPKDSWDRVCVFSDMSPLPYFHLFSP
jgi:endonuclease III